MIVSEKPSVPRCRTQHSAPGGGEATPVAASGPGAGAPRGGVPEAVGRRGGWRLGRPSSRSVSGSSRASTLRTSRRRPDPSGQPAADADGAGLPKASASGALRRSAKATRPHRGDPHPRATGALDETSGGGGSGAGGRDPQSGSPGRVWVVEGDKLKSVQLTLGISDGSATEVLRGDLSEGQDLVIGAAGAASRPTGGQGQGQGSTAPRPRL